jgi:hypothetical protein
MKSYRSEYFNKFILVVSALIIITGESKSQDIQFSLFADPLISWFSTDTKETVNSGVRPGFSVGLSYDRYFAENYAFSTGIFLLNASGRVSYSDTINIQFKNSVLELPENEDITYKIQYVSIPLGLKFRTNQIGYLTFFSNIGLDPKVLIAAKADIPEQSIEDENISEELNSFNLGYHLALGTEYSLGGKTALVFGLSYENNFLDITKDNAGQPVDKVRHNIFRFKLGVNF